MGPDNTKTLGDPDQWVDRYGDSLFRFARSRVKDDAVAEDLVQETFLAALQGRSSFRGSASPASWLTGILKHKIVDHFRRSFRERPVEEEVLQHHAVDALFQDNGHWRIGPRRWEIDPGRVIEQKEFMDAYYRCLAGLPKRLADLFVLREMDGLSTDELCKEMGITATNSWVMLYRARMALRRCLEELWGGDPVALE